MLRKQFNNKRDQGFTIIEVMIVLAIAGLILLVVFLAVPALQRTSRNTQRKDDAAAIGGAVSNVMDNNNGQLPSGVATDASGSTSVDICGAGGTTAGAAGSTACTATSDFETAKLGYYASTGVWIEAAAATPAVPTVGTTAAATVVTTDSVLIVTGEQCPNGAGAPVASARSVVVFYAIENGNGAGTLQCLAE